MYHNINVCATSCPTGQFIDPDLPNTCSLCDIGCNSCSGTSYTCTKCQTVAGVTYYLSGTKCLTNCPLGQFSDLTQLNVCTVCASGCS